MMERKLSETVAMQGRVRVRRKSNNSVWVIRTTETPPGFYLSSVNNGLGLPIGQLICADTVDEMFDLIGPRPEENHGD